MLHRTRTMINTKSYTLARPKKEMILKSINTYIQSCNSVLFAFVYGSFLEDDLPFRDINIAIFIDEEIAGADLLDLCLELSAMLSTFDFIEKTRLEYFDLKPMFEDNLKDLLLAAPLYTLSLNHCTTGRDRGSSCAAGWLKAGLMRPPFKYCACLNYIGRPFLSFFIQLELKRRL